MSVATPAASRLLCRSLAANSAKNSSPRTMATNTTSRPSIPPPSSSCHPRQRHHFHTTPPTLKTRPNRSPYHNVTAKKLGLLNPETAPAVMAHFKGLMSPDYDDTDVAALEKKYTPEQLESLALGERVIDPSDIVMQGRIRNDVNQPIYLEDWATTRPVLDRRPVNFRPVDTSARFMTLDEFGDDFLEWVRELDAKSRGSQKTHEMKDALAIYEEMRSKVLARNDGKGITLEEAQDAIERVIPPDLPTSPDRRPARPEIPEEEDEASKAEAIATTMEMYKYMTERNAMTGFDGGSSLMAPELPDKVPGVAGMYKKELSKEDQALDPEGIYQDLSKQSGMSIQLISVLFQSYSKILVRRYVSNQTRLGKIRSTYILAICGNRDGWLGMGEAKSVDPETSQAKAKLAAIKNMRPIRRYEMRTIYGDVQGKVGGTIVKLFTRPPGFGLRVSHRIFEMARAAGITDLAAKMPRARNPMNSVKACFQALTNQPDPEKIAIGRGMKLVDARKVYYGGATL